MVAVGECITEAPIHGLPFLRDPFVYIHAIVVVNPRMNSDFETDFYTVLSYINDTYSE